MYADLYQSVLERFGTGNSGQSMGDWILENTFHRGRKFSFKGYEFQKAIADDMHPELSVIKPSQTGLTEVQLRKFLAILARNTGCAGIFSMPNGNMLKRTYNARLKPIIEGASIFNPPGVTPVRRYDQVQIRDSFGYLTGCTDGDATSTSADFLMHDEVDLSPMDILDLYQSRLQNSDMKITQRFSTPTWGGYGIDKFYQMSNQFEYFQRCQSCNHEQIPVFTPEFVKIPDINWEVEDFLDLAPESILTLDTHEAFIVCQNCGKRLDVANPTLRQWVARFPSRSAFRGYRVRPFSTSRLPPGYIFSRLAKALNEGTIRHFRNTVLGETHNSADSQIQRGDIETCMKTPTTPEVSQDTLVYIGLDVGFTCYLTLSFDDEVGLPVYFRFMSFPMALLHDKIAELRKQYNIARGAADRFPFEPDVDALRVTTNNLIMPVQYRGNNPLAPVKDELGMITHYSANPTFHLDRIHTMIGQHKLVLAGYGHQKETLMTHLTDNVRDERPDQPATWRKNPGEDHYFHAMAFGQIARRIHEHAVLLDNHTEPKVSAMLVAAPQSESGGSMGLSRGHGTGFRRVSRLG
jgi:transcription elongation factor Elf1